MLTVPLMKRMWPRAKPELIQGIVSSSDAVFLKYRIAPALVVAHVMAQISHESGAGTIMVENLNYSASRMMAVWPGRFPFLSSTKGFAFNPRALANKVYNGRMGNRTGSNDGWMYRGRGASQTTGREGYERLGRVTGLDLINHPELVIEPDHYLECGVADFVNCGCLPYAQHDDVAGVTKHLNGGYIGLAERRVWLSRWKKELGL